MAVDGRPRGILSESDRDHLKNPEKRSPAASHKRRTAIPKRFEHAIRDGTLLWEEWDEDDRSTVFDENLNDPEFRNGIVNLLALIYAETRWRGRFKNLLTRALRKAERDRLGELQDFKVKLEIEPVSRVEVEEALARYRKRGELSDMSDTELAVIAKLLRRQEGKAIAYQAEEAWQEKLDAFGFDDEPDE